MTKAAKRPVGMDIHTRLRSSTTERHYEDLKKNIYLERRKRSIVRKRFVTVQKSQWKKPLVSVVGKIKNKAIAAT